VWLREGVSAAKVGFPATRRPPDSRQRDLSLATAHRAPAVGSGRVNFSVGSNTCVGATLAFQQTCDVTVGFRSQPATFPFGSGDRGTLSLVSDASHAETVTLLASSRQLMFP